MKICVYAIALNEAAHVNRFCEAAKDADQIVVADTGSTDGTVELLRANGAIVHDIRIKPWRFDDARNACLALLPSDIDVCVSLDLDEELQPGWREEIERVWTEGATRLWYKFDWGCGIAFFYEKIHARHGYRWRHPCHESPYPDRIEQVYARTEKLLVVHKPDPTKSRGQYLDLLKVAVEEDPQCPHEGFYYARELSFAGRYADAIVEVNRYLTLPRAVNVNERCYAMRTAARCFEALGQIDTAIKWLQDASREAPQTREPWFELSKMAYFKKDWQASYDAAMTCLAITQREDLYTVDPGVWEGWPHGYASIAAWNLGRYDEALEQARLAVEKSPDDGRLVDNLTAIESAREEAA